MPILSRKGLQLPVIIGVASLLGGCVLPEHLDGDIVMTGYHYEVTLQGKLAEPRTIGALVKGRALPPDHDARMKAQEAAALAFPGMIRFAYVGEGRYEFAMTVEGELSETTRVVSFPNTKGDSNNFLTIRRETDGMVVISSPEVSPRMLADLADAGIEATGTIRIRADCAVLESSADEQPRNGPHVWNRALWNDRIFLRIDPNRRR